MIYLTEASVLTRIKADDLSYITGGNLESLAELELDAIQEMSSYLANRYDSDAIFAPDQIEADKFPIIRRMLTDILLYNAHVTANPRNIPEYRVQRRDDAVSWLKRVSDPRNLINAEYLPKKDISEESGRGLTWNSRTKRENYY